MTAQTFKHPSSFKATAAEVASATRRLYQFLSLTSHRLISEPNSYSSSLQCPTIHASPSVSVHSTMESDVHQMYISARHGSRPECQCQQVARVPTYSSVARSASADFVADADICNLRNDLTVDRLPASVFLLHTKQQTFPVNRRNRTV